ncbi:MAG: helix-turn-helix transcriptional regulator [Coleofasciculus sp. G3-WIS-01]|uniref:helix-turn-helix domain-containing protein n=1 Tax=Coleofasciculus sp. G3-WIS-01 TaxID=3069528 RepID=UPI0032F7E253
MIDKKQPPGKKLSLKQFRADVLGMSQREFAEAIGSTQNTIARYESGRHKSIKFSLDQICEIEDLLRTHGLTFRNLRGLEK